MDKVCLYQQLIQKIRFGRFNLRLNPSFRNVLWCFDVLSDEIISDTDKVDLCLSVLLKHPTQRHLIPRNQRAKLFQTLFDAFINANRTSKKTTSKKSMDFRQDAGYIIAAFRQCYGLDLVGKDRNLHWWIFYALLGALSDDTRLMQIISIRTKPIPKPTKHNAEERAAIIQLKQEYALKLTEEERKAQYQEGLQKIAITLQRMAKSR